MNSISLSLRSRVAFFWHKGEGSLTCPPLQPQLRNKTYIWNPITNYIPHILYSLYSVKALFAANYYRIKGLLLTTTFIINILILLTTEARYTKIYKNILFVISLGYLRKQDRWWKMYFVSNSLLVNTCTFHSLNHFYICLLASQSMTSTNKILSHDHHMTRCHS